MTVSSTDNKIVYAGDDVTTVFIYTFRVDSDSDMQVFLGEVLQSTDYIVNRNPDNIGGDITFSAAPVLDEIVTLLRVVPETQGVDYQPYDAFPAETHEDALDKLTMIAQQHAEELGRVPKEPIGSPPEPEPGYAHNLTSNRDAEDCHSITAVTNLQTALDALQAEIDINASNIADNAVNIVRATPPGMFGEFGGTSPPTGWLVCDGSAVSEAAYPDLFAAIGHTWDTTNGAVAPGAGLFRLPPSKDATSGFGLYTRGVGDLTSVGEYQEDDVLPHNHPELRTAVTYGTGSTRSAVVPGTGLVGNDSTGEETRPHSITVLMCIKT